MKFYQETTEWDNRTPNHVYLLDDSKSKMFAYVRAGTKSVFSFKTPIPISTRGRKFVEVKNTFGYSIQDDSPQTEKWTVTGSKGDKYTVRRVDGVLQCSCTGYKYHGKCKHAKQIEDKLK